ncbi:MAG: hypothetical protein AABX32_06440 [Nanoarchaeota archaeon]
MALNGLVQKLAEIARTNGFQVPREPVEKRIEEAERAFSLGRAYLEKSGKLGRFAIDAMETAIEVFFRCGDHEQVRSYTIMYNDMLAVQHS